MIINQPVSVIIDIFVLTAALVSVVFTFGVVWRVEKELDVSFKLFLGSISAFTFGEISKFIGLGGGLFINAVAAFSKMLFIVLFLGGILAMRDLLRKMDGEKKSKDFYANIPAKEK